MIVGTEEELLAVGRYGFAKVEGSRLEFRSDVGSAARVRVSTQVADAVQISFLTRFLTSLGQAYGPFAGAMLWVTDADTLPDGARAIALQGMELQRRAFGETRPVEVAPVHYFQAHEFEASLSMLVLAIVGGLDGYYYPNWGSPEYFLRLSAGSYVELQSCNAELMADTIAKLERLQWVKFGIPAS